MNQDGGRNEESFQEVKGVLGCGVPLERPGGRYELGERGSDSTKAYNEATVKVSEPKKLL